MTDYIKRDWKKLQEIYDNAEKENSFVSLIPHPILLYTWQAKHRQDLIKIAAIASHRLEKHRWCKTQEICDKIQALINKGEGVKSESTYTQNHFLNFIS